MDENKEHLENLSEIRALMERSSRFISLSGLSGVFAGIMALAGAGVAYWYLKLDGWKIPYSEYSIQESSGRMEMDFFTFFALDAFTVLGLSIVVGILLTRRRAKKHGQTIWDPTAKKLLINLVIPLAAGGIFCMILLSHGAVALIAPCTLLFYGLGLVNASKYTLTDIKWLGLSEIALGLIASFYIGYGLIFWAIGFGVLHIVYGTLMYFKYER
jgi:predicted lysophospholipase L1 biosynthesis ABC-type transport system permease subunit